MTQTTYRRIIEAGQDVAARLAALKAEQVAPSATRAGCFADDSLVAFQRRVARAGYLEAEIVESLRGFTVRYASGLQNCGIIACSRQTGGTLEGAIAVAKRWQEADPAHRFVSRIVAEG